MVLKAIVALGIGLFLILQYSLFNFFVLAFLFVIGLLSFRGNASKIFINFFLTFTSFALITDQIYVVDQFQDFFYTIDTRKFMRFSADVQFANNLQNLIHQLLLNPDFIGYNLINKFLFLFGKSFGEVNQLLLKSQNIFLASIIVVYVYKLINLYYPNSLSLKVATLYGFLTVVFTFSVVLNRDIHVALLFLLYFYTVLKSDKLPLLKLLLISLLGFLFRPEHGIILLFLALILFAFGFYEKVNKRSKFSTLLVLNFCLIIPVLFLLSNQINFIIETYQSYKERTAEVASDGSFAIYLNHILPFGIKQIVLGCYSQFAPLPFWRNLVPGPSESGNSIFRLQEAIAGIFWPLVFFGSLLSIRLKKSIIFPRKVLILFLFSLIIIAGSSVEINVRRIFIVYPIIYLMFLPFILSFTKQTRIAVIFLFFCCSVGLQSLILV